MQTALSKLKAFWAAGEHRKALKLAASWPELGDHDEAIRNGWSAASNPNFIKQLGRNPDEDYKAGLAAVAERYDLT